MNVGDIPRNDREAILGPLKSWMQGVGRISWMLGNDRQRVTSVTPNGSPAPITGAGTTVSLNIKSNSTGFAVNVLVFYGEPDSVTNLSYLAEMVLPVIDWDNEDLSFKGKTLFGVKQLVNITSTNQNVNIQIPATGTSYPGFELPFFVYVTENISFVKFDAYFVGKHDFQAKFTFDYSAPVFDAFTFGGVEFGFVKVDLNKRLFEQNPKSLFTADKWEKERFSWKRTARVSMTGFVQVLSDRVLHDTTVGLLISTSPNPIYSIFNATEIGRAYGYKRGPVTPIVTGDGIYFDAEVISSNTTYYLRAFGYNGKTTYGPQLTINTPTWGDGEIL